MRGREETSSFAVFSARLWWTGLIQDSQLSPLPPLHCCAVAEGPADPPPLPPTPPSSIFVERWRTVKQILQGFAAFAEAAAAASRSADRSLLPPPPLAGSVSSGVEGLYLAADFDTLSSTTLIWFSVRISDRAARYF